MNLFDHKTNIGYRLALPNPMDTASLKELRRRTGASLADCKRILAETGNNMDRAVERIRELCLGGCYTSSPGASKVFAADVAQRLKPFPERAAHWLAPVPGGLAGVALGMTEDRVRTLLGEPAGGITSPMSFDIDLRDEHATLIAQLSGEPRVVDALQVRLFPYTASVQRALVAALSAVITAAWGPPERSAKVGAVTMTRWRTGGIALELLPAQPAELRDMGVLRIDVRRC